MDAGTAQLESYLAAHEGDMGWSHIVRSYWAGYESGGFNGWSEVGGSRFLCTTTFGPFGRVPSADACTKSSTQVYLDN
jgi:hypothetical protein